MPNHLRDEFEQNGYLVLRNFFATDEIETLMEDLQVAAALGKKDFLSQGNMDFYSGLFRRSHSLQAHLSQPKIVDLLSQIIGPDIWIRWDQAVAKAPGAGVFPWHQDNGYNGLKNIHYQFWIALTDMTSENGGLWVQPGSHQRLLPHKWVENHMVCKVVPENPVFIEAQAGDVVVFSSLLLHSTMANVTPADTRWAYVVEYMSMEHYDPVISPPYFVVARGGQPQPEFVLSYAGSRNLRNRLTYLDYQLTHTAKALAKSGLKQLGLR